MTRDAGPDADASPFRFAYDPGVVRYGRGSVARLEDELAEQGFERALVVCGSTVGDTPAVIDPVREGLGDRLAGVFAETTPEKRLDTAYDALAAARARDADVIVGLGGGSSLDVAKVASVLAGTDRDREAVGRAFGDTGTIAVPPAPLLPVVAVPTTLAGADLSIGAGVTAASDSGLVDAPTSGGVSDPRLMPRAVVYDPALFATTPPSVLAGSAMNGFDKGIESLYAHTATPITDATAVRGVDRMADGLVALGRHGADPARLEPAVEGLVLVQYGISRADGSTLSIVHAFGHGLARVSDLQQGVAHAVVVPHVLRYLFEADGVDARRRLLASALGVGDAPEPAGAVVDAVERVRDALDLPTRLRDVDDAPGPETFPAVAEAILADSLMANAPPGLDPTPEAIEAVLEAAH